jgi:hypothetical protein
MRFQRPSRAWLAAIALGVWVSCLRGPAREAPGGLPVDPPPGIAPLLPGPATPRASMVFLQSWDGAPNHVVQELLSKGLLPNLARLRRQALWSEKGLLPAFPSQTAPGHARIWTGAPERINGISGNTVLPAPRGEHTILHGRSGFDGALLQAEPIWITAARQGKSVLVWNAPQAHPYPPLLANDPNTLTAVEQRLRILHGYGDPLLPSALLDVSELGTGSRELQLGPLRARVWSPEPSSEGVTATGAEAAAAIERHPAGAAIRVDILGAEAPRKILLRNAARGLAAFSQGLLLPEAAVLYFRLFPAADGGLRLYHNGVSTGQGNGLNLLEPLVADGGGMILNGPHDLYLRGQFGPTLAQGGSGLAEECYLEVLGQLLEVNRRSMALLLQGRRWDLVINYLPLPDEALHLWYGWVDRDLAPKHRAVSRRIRPLVERLLGLLDAHLGALLSQLGPHDSFLLVSDHGMDGCDRELVLNEALRLGGYLQLDRDGRVDLSRTRAYYGPGNSAWIVINTTDWRDGIVHPEEVPAVSEEIGRFLMGLKDPEDGTHLVRGVFLPHNASRDYGGEAAGQIYVDAMPGVYLRAGLAQGRLVERSAPSGQHMFHPSRPEMRALLFARSPRLRARVLPGPVSQLALAPTVCALLEIKPAQTMAGLSLLDSPGD